LSQDELIKLYKKADISITRGSATSLAEQDQFDIKKIIVPLPYTG
jgi:UDP-N-acetylglucosamine:LPS N-acetylglucosamine transferase